MGKTTSHKRSLHIFGALSRGGAETWFLQALAHRCASHWVADVCLLAGEEGACATQARALGARLLHCPYRPAATFPARFLRLLRRERYDVVHSHVLLFSGAICALANLAGTPLRVAHAHNSSDGRGNGPARELYRALMRRATAQNANLVLACSREAARAFDSPDARILPYGIELSPFTRPSVSPSAAELRSRFGIPAAARVLAAVGRLTKQKNHAFLLAAFAQTLRLRCDLHLLIVGQGELASDLESQVERLQLRGRVHLLGLRDDVPALLAGVCNGFAMPSLHEGLPVALLEAQAAGLPCLISEAVSNEAVVIAEQVEKLALGGPWAARLAALAAKPRLDPAIAVARLVQGGFDVAQSWPRLTALYEAALGGRWSAQAA